MLQTGGLTIENRLHRLSVFRSVDLTRDTVALKKSRRVLEVARSVPRGN